MVIDRFKNWAKHQTAKPRVPVSLPAVQRAPTVVEPSPFTNAQRYVPPVPQSFTPQQPRQMAVFQPPPPMAQTCLIVRPARDTYAELLSTIPELTGTVVPDYSGGVDAMKLAGRPCDAPMEKWRASSERTYGDSDARAQGRKDEHLARYGVSASEFVIRR